MFNVYFIVIVVGIVCLLLLFVCLFCCWFLLLFLSLLDVSKVYKKQGFVYFVFYFNGLYKLETKSIVLLVNVYIIINLILILYQNVI